LYYPADIIRVVESRRMRWARHVARSGELTHNIFYHNLKGLNYLEDLCINGKIFLKWVLKIGSKHVDWIRLKIESSGGLL
jgi:hypothetical protein